MKLLKYSIIFLIINFGALGIGVLLMNDGPVTNWYTNLNKAPWTPPGWFFGFAWSSIMLCYSLYMAYLLKIERNIKLIALFSTQFVLNVIWNYIFFNKHLIFAGLLCIILLTLVVLKFMLDYKKTLKIKTALIIPYFVWLCIATSLNLYILIYN